VNEFHDDVREDAPDFEMPPGTEANGHDAESAFNFPIYTAKQILALPPVPMRIPGLSLPKKGLAGLVGPSGHGKGLVSEDMAVSLATGGMFREFVVVQCPVAIIVAEGFHGIAGRERAVYAHRGIAEDTDVPLYYIAAAPQLDDPMAADQVAADLRRLDPRPEVLLVDTYRATNSGDENDSTDAARYIRSLQMLAGVIDGLVLTIIHAPWQGDRERGSTAWRAAQDWVGLVQKQDDIITMTCLKAKDGPEFKPLRWRIEARADSATVIPIGEAEEERETPRRWADVPHSGQKVLETLAQSFDDQGATSANLRKASKVPESTFFRVVKQLGDWGLIMKHKSRLLLTATARSILP
jgi:hypothetical protein